MKLIVARHGETEWNRKNKVLGRTDIPLNDVGIEQAEELAKILSEYELDVIFTSPLDRAWKTGQIIANYTHTICKKEDLLIEQNFGLFEGVDRGSASYQSAKRMYAARYPEGESYFDVAARIYPFLEKLKIEYLDKTVLLITHGGVCRVINSFFINMGNEEFSTYVIPNCGFKEYVL